MHPLQIQNSLLQGKAVTASLTGNSMTPRIHSGQEVTILPLSPEEEILPGDVVFCRVKGRLYFHLVKAIRASGNSILIGNNYGHLNGWTPRKNIYGKLASSL